MRDTLFPYTTAFRCHAYNRDTQEVTPPLLDTVDTVSACLAVYAGMIPAIEVRRDNCRAAAARGFSTATDLADYLVNKGLPFRDAHHVVGSTVAFAQQKGCDIAELSLAELRTFSELIGEDVYAKITQIGRAHV